VTKFEFEFANVSTSNLFNRFKIWHMC